MTRKRKDPKPVEEEGIPVPEPAAEKPAEPILNEDFSYVSPADGKTYTMTMKERLFADYYLEFFGNGVQAVFNAGYDVKNARVAAAIAYENLRKPHIIGYINSLLEERGFNDDNVEKQHMFILQQHADLKVKAKAIEMYYKLRGKIKDPALLAVDPATLEAVNKALSPLLSHGTQGNTGQ